MKSVTPTAVTVVTDVSGVYSPYTPKFISGMDGTYPTYYPGGKTIAELQKTPSPLKRKINIVTPYWEPEAKIFQCTGRELSRPFPLPTPEVPRLSEDFGPMPTIAVELPSEHVVPSQPKDDKTPIMVEWTRPGERPGRQLLPCKLEARQPN